METEAEPATVLPTELCAPPPRLTPLGALSIRKRPELLERAELPALADRAELPALADRAEVDPALPAEDETVPEAEDPPELPEVVEAPDAEPD